MKLGEGDVIAGRYRLERKLGTGGMGTVWAAEHLALHSPVAVKLLEADVAADPNMRQRFVAEARAAANVRGAHVVQVFDFGVERDAPYIVMELLRGESLGDRLRRDGPLTLAETVKFIGHISMAMTTAHAAGIVHRDLKPDNVFIVREQDEYAKVLDFGIAKVIGEDALSVRANTDSGIAMGTPFYLSPEQARDSRDVDYRSDLWALGVVAFECLTGKRPFLAETFGELLLLICVSPLPVPSDTGSVPHGFDEWFEKAVQREREARFQSADELARALETILAGEPPIEAWKASVAATNSTTRDTELASIHVSFRHSEASGSSPLSPGPPSGTMTSVSLEAPVERRVIEVDGTSALNFEGDEPRSSLRGVYAAAAFGMAVAAVAAWFGSRAPAPVPAPGAAPAALAPASPRNAPAAGAPAGSAKVTPPAPSSSAAGAQSPPRAEDPATHVRRPAAPAATASAGEALDDPRFGGRR